MIANTNEKFRRDVIRANLGKTPGRDIYEKGVIV